MYGVQIEVGYCEEWKSWGVTIYCNGYEEYEGYYFHTKQEAIDCAKSFEQDVIVVYTKDYSKYKEIKF